MAPFVPITVALAAGLLCGAMVALPLWSTVAAGLLMAFTATWVGRRARWALFLGFFFLGGTSWTLQLDLVETHQRWADSLAEKKAGAVSATVTWVEGRPDGSHLVSGDTLEVMTRSDRTALWSWPGSVIIHWRGGAPPKVGQRIVFRAKILGITGKNGAQRALLSQGFIARTWIDKPLSVARLPNISDTGDKVFGWVAMLRGWAEDRLRRVEPAVGRRLLWGMLLGPSRAVGGRLKESFSRLGLAHLLVISGLHMATVAAVVFALSFFVCRRVPGLTARISPRRAAALASLPFVWLYVGIAGGSAATLRAGVMISCPLTAVLCFRKAHGWNSWALAAGICLVWRPQWLQRPGFQLSFLAVGALLWLAERQIHRAREKEPFGVPEHRFAVRRLGGWVCVLAASSLIVTVAISGVLMFHFGRLTPWAVVLNVVAIPVFLWGVFPMGLIALCACVSWYQGGAVMLAWAGTLAQRSGLAVVWLADKTISWQPAMDGWSGGMVALYYIVVIGLMPSVHPPARRRFGALRVVVGVVALCGLAYSVTRPEVPDRSLRVTFFDVGAGEAVLLEIGATTRVLVDGGGGPRPPQGRFAARVIVSALKKKSITQLDLVVVTHSHDDHVAGLIDVLQTVYVKELWIVGPVEPHTLLARLLRVAHRRGVRVTRPRDRVIGAVRIDVLHPRPGPDQTVAVHSLWSINDNSIVLRVAHPAGSLLLTGDIEQAAEQWLIARSDTLTTDVLKVPHHGSTTSSTSAFITAVSPSLAVICGGRRHEAVLTRYEQSGAEVRRTRRHGTVEVIFARGRIRVTHTGRSFRLKRNRAKRQPPDRKPQRGGRSRRSAGSRKNLKTPRP
jgi:competence protein ComEC